MDKEIKSYIEKLDAALGDFESNAFENLVQELEAQPAKLVKPVAKQWTKRITKEVNSKKKAIAAIKRRRESLRVGRAKSIATGNRTAA